MHRQEWKTVCTTCPYINYMIFLYLISFPRWVFHLLCPCREPVNSHKRWRTAVKQQSCYLIHTSYFYRKETNGNGEKMGCQRRMGQNNNKDNIKMQENITKISLNTVWFLLLIILYFRPEYSYRFRCYMFYIMSVF